jgi:hypothetical protein
MPLLNRTQAAATPEAIKSPATTLTHPDDEEV